MVRVVNQLVKTAAPSAALHRIAARFNGRIVVADIVANRDPLPETNGDVVVVVKSGMTEDLFARLMEKPFRACLEDGEDMEDMAEEPRLAITAAENSLYFWLTTATAFRISTEHHVCTALETRGGLSAARRGDVETALQEALTNALIHGNLGLASTMRDDFQHYARFCTLLETRLQACEGQRRVEIAATWKDGWLEVSVMDHGEGFAETEKTKTPAAGGVILHGLGIIRSLASAVTFADAGRCLIMRFAP